MTQNQQRRVIQAMTETQDALNRAMRYSPDLRDMKLIAFYNEHIASLTEMLKTDTLPRSCYIKQEG
jgi:hypothetical protein